jgi:hypothetical protein
MRDAAAVVRRQEHLYPPPWLAPDDRSVFVSDPATRAGRPDVPDDGPAGRPTWPPDWG